MLRNDGNYDIYVLEFLSDKKWRKLNFDVSWVVVENYVHSLWKEFTASGDCWQKTGVHGTFKLEDAIKLFCTLKEHSIRDFKFRVVKVTISQKSEVMWGENGNSAGESQRIYASGWFTGYGY